MITTILFDLDGTIIDSEPLACKSLQAGAADWGINLSEKDATVVTGKKWDIALDLIYPMLPASAKNKSKEAFTENVMKHYKRMIETDLGTVPGVLDAIHDFSKHYQLALVSGSYREDVLWALEKFKVLHLFKHVLGSEDYVQSKPSPEGYLKAIKLFQVRPEQCLVFEDSEPGIQSALDAGAYAVAITSTNQYNQNQNKAHRKIKDFTGIGSKWVKEFKGK